MTEVGGCNFCSFISRSHTHTHRQCLGVDLSRCGVSGHRDGDPGIWRRRGPKFWQVVVPTTLEAGKGVKNIQPLQVQCVHCSKHGNHYRNLFRRIVVHKNRVSKLERGRKGQ